MPRKRSGEESVATDEREWEDWRRLREELGKRLGSRDATGEIDESLLRADRRGVKKPARRR